MLSHPFSDAEGVLHTSLARSPRETVRDHSLSANGATHTDIESKASSVTRDCINSLTGVANGRFV
jgi:hypothetical protein